jgi:hypothetical protein
VPFGNAIHGHEADVVPVAGILWARITESDKKLHDTRTSLVRNILRAIAEELQKAGSILNLALNGMSTLIDPLSTCRKPGSNVALL